jgi:DNA-binding CsgD family transcriptional regulator
MTTSHIPVQHTEQIIDALNRAIDMDVTPEQRTEFLLGELQVVLNRAGRSQLLLLEDLARVPAPRVARRHVVRPPGDHAPVADLAPFQTAFDEAMPLLGPAVRAVLADIRTPRTVIGELDAHGGAWFQDHFRDKYVRPFGYEDIIVSIWAASRDRAIAMLLFRPASSPPFDETDRTLMSLMLRAVAPLVDRDIFQDERALMDAALTPRQIDVLQRLLTGDSKKQIARQLTLSQHTVHAHIRQIYKTLDVASRGELMSRFVDRKLLRLTTETASAMAGV